MDGWQLAGMIQFDGRGRPAFLHRTLNKFWPGAEAWPLERLTGPLPFRFVFMCVFFLYQTFGPALSKPDTSKGFFL